MLSDGDFQGLLERLRRNDPGLTSIDLERKCRRGLKHVTNPSSCMFAVLQHHR